MIRTGNELVRSLAFAIAVTAIGFVAVAAFGGNFNGSIFLLTLCYAVVLIGMVVQVGYSHQLAFHQAVFMMVGAYGVGVLNIKFGMATWVASLIVVPGAAIVGGIIGSYITRVPGFALALVTLFFSSIVGGFVQYSTYLGGTNGMGPIAYLWAGSSYTGNIVHGSVLAVLVVGVLVFVGSRIMHSGIGLELALLSFSERMAGSVGIRTARRKQELFIFGSAVAALGGCLFAGTQQFVTPDTFTQTAEISLLVMLYFGGRRSLAGGLIGAIIIEYIAGINNFVALNQGIIEGVLITAVLLFASDGIIGAFHTAWDWTIDFGGERGWWDRIRRFSGRSPILAAVVARNQDGHANMINGASDVSDHLQTTVAGAVNSAIGTTLEAQAGAVLECRDVTKRFGGVVAVEAVSLQIHGTGIHAVCGPNGAGKSTLFELIGGGFRPDEGDIYMRGEEITKLSSPLRAERGMARTFQSVGLMGSRSVIDNVAVAAVRSHRTFLPRAVYASELAQARRRSLEVLTRVGIADMASRRVSQLTLEAQRMVELARAIVGNPTVMLLDEPASGLSAEQRRRLAALLQEMARDRTIVLVEHDLEMVAEIAEEIFVLVEGRLVFQGTSDEFVQSEIVRTELMGLVGAEGAGLR